MADSKQLFLHHELMLLALKDEDGVPFSGTMYLYGLAGGMMAELLLQQRIALAPERKKQFVELLDRSPLGDPALDSALTKIAAAKRRAALDGWVRRLATQQLKHVVAGELCRRGVLRADESSVLLIFKRKVYPELDPRPEHRLVDRLRRAIVGEGRTVDPRTVILVSLADKAGLLKTVFSKQDLKLHKKRIEQIVNGELTGQATGEAIQAVQSAAVMVAIMPALMASTITHSRH